MTEIKHDPDLPFAVVESTSGKVYGRFADKGDATWYAADAELSLIDTTPIPLPERVGSVILLKNSMPLIRVGDNHWLMPQTGAQLERNVGAWLLAQPIGHERRIYTDEEVRDYVGRNKDAVMCEAP